MPKKARELTAVEVRRLTRPGFHAVGGVDGLHLSVNANGARSWILRYAVGEKISANGKPYIQRRDLGLGGFPDVPLQQAREKARKVKDDLADGIDPLAQKKAARAALRAAQVKSMTFAKAMRLCHQKKRPEFKSDKHANDWINSLVMHAEPIIGNLPVDQIELADVLKVLEPIWQEKTETATRVRQRIEAVMAFCIVSGYRQGDNPARWEGNLKEVLPTPSKIRKVKHMAALPWQTMPQFMADLRQRDGAGARALEFIVLTAARSGEVRMATWDEIDLDAKVWTVPAERMKAGKAHRVPLSDAAVSLLESLPHREGYLFAGMRGQPLSDMSISAVCKRMDVPAVPHGMRSSFKDWCRSATSYADEVSELALAHVNSDATRAAYARDELLPKRAKLMADWSHYLAKPVECAKVISIKTGIDTKTERA